VNKTENELIDLIPKSIDEEEIMLKKALELSLKYSEENKVKEYVSLRNVFYIVLNTLYIVSIRYLALLQMIFLMLKLKSDLLIGTN
jgi:hypothetical protein